MERDRETNREKIFTEEGVEDLLVHDTTEAAQFFFCFLYTCTTISAWQGSNQELVQ